MFFLMAVPLRGGPGCKGPAIQKKKKLFFRLPFSLERGGAKALMAWPLKSEIFCGFPYITNTYLLLTLTRFANRFLSPKFRIPLQLFFLIKHFFSSSDFAFYVHS